MTDVRRAQALGLKRNGMRADQIAQILGADVDAVREWIGESEPTAPARSVPGPAVAAERLVEEAEAGAMVAVVRLREMLELGELSPPLAIKASGTLINGYARIQSVRAVEEERSAAGSQPMTLEDLRALLLDLPADVRAALLAPDA